MLLRNRVRATALRHLPSTGRIVASRSFSVSASRYARPPQYPGGFGPPGSGGGGGFPIGNIFNQEPKKSGDTLREHSIDLCALAKDSKLDNVIGRDEEIKRIIQILSRRTKANPVLLGEAGTGKTAIVEGLANRIVNRDVPESLFNKRVLAVDLSSLVSGTGIRGSFEEKLKALVKDIQDDPNVIVFIDELHGLLNLGKAEGSISGGNILKPALARGLKIIGATTFDEYRTTIEKDAALSRRFQPVSVHEPSPEEAITMLRGLRSRYETHHGVAISDSALVAAVNMSKRYITDRFLPDKAIDVLDEAASALAMQQESKPEPLEQIEREAMKLQIELESLRKDTDPLSNERKEVIERTLADKAEEAARMTSVWQAEKDRLTSIKEAKRNLEEAEAELVESQRNGDFTKASRLQYQTIPDLKKQIPSEEEAAADQQKRIEAAEGDESAVVLRDRVTPEDVSRVIGRATGIPVRSLMRGDVERLLHMEDELRKKVVGQETALQAVSEAVRMSRAGLNAEGRPLASFLFLGPTGSGKTELAKTLAAFLFDSERALITLNMSEYMEKHTVSRLVGSPPGYVGHEEGGQLTERVRRAPYAVVLFDEFEKAHRDVSNILLQVLDEGKLVDSLGRTANFANTIVILTSNLGANILADSASSDAEGRVTPEATRDVLSVVEASYPPELLNRLDSQVVFNRISQHSMLELVDLRMQELRRALSDKRVDLILEDDAREYLAKNGYSTIYGARALNRLIAKELRSPLASLLIQGLLQPGGTARVQLEGDALRVSPA